MTPYQKQLLGERLNRIDIFNSAPTERRRLGSVKNLNLHLGLLLEVFVLLKTEVVIEFSRQLGD